MLMSESKIVKVYPLSFLQEGMLFYSLLDNHSTAYFIQNNMTISGELDIDLVRASFSKLMERYEVLRTFFVSEKVKTPVQAVLKHRDPSVYFEDISHLSDTEKEKYVQQCIHHDKQRGFDLKKDVLMRAIILKTAEHEYKAIWSFHHIIIDGWCMGIVIGEFTRIYSMLRQGEEVVLEPTQPYSSYIEWLGKQDKTKNIAYWKEYLDGYENAASPFGKTVAQNNKGYRPEEVRVLLDRKMTSSLSQFSMNNGITVNAFMQTIWGILLQKYNRTNDVVYGYVTSGRPPEVPGIERMVGLFINTLPIRIKSAGTHTFRKLSVEVYQQSLARRAHEYCSLADIQATTELRNDLINHIFVYENYPVENSEEQFKGETNYGFSIKDREICEHTNYDLTVMVMPGDELLVTLNYNAMVFSKDNMQRLGQHLKQITEAVIRNPDIQLNELEMVTEEEQHKILVEFNETASEFPRDKTLPEMFMEQVRRTPDHIAIAYDDTTMTYKQLDEKSNQLARTLLIRGVKSGDTVAILVERSLEMMVGIIAILKAGGAYVPLDRKMPVDRINFMLKDSGTKFILVQGNTSDSMTFLETTIDLDDLNNYDHDREEIEIQRNPNHLAYIIYTSGSTGIPKGVMIEDYSVINRINWMQKQYPLKENDVILQKTPHTFDVSVWELFWWSFVGAKLYLLKPGREKEPESIIEAIEQENITTIHFVPSMLHAFLDQVGSQEYTHDTVFKLRSLKYVFASGEALTLNQVNRFNDLLWRGNHTKLINLYGPTEATIDVSYFNCSTDVNLNLIPIGKPIDNIKLYVLDQYHKLCPVGVAGELCIEGVGLARGYINRDELTKEKFIDSPFTKESKIYLTGDLARWLPDGNIEYLGRLDHQVKIRGFRIELGEIESSILKHQQINETVVLVNETEHDKALIAFIVAGKEIVASEMRVHLSKDLPDYMIPSLFVQVDHIPLTPNGKLDRKELLSHTNRVDSGTPFVPPSNEMEQKLSIIWQEILSVGQVGVTDRFFDLGGHSLKTTILRSRIQKEFDTLLHLGELFTSPTIQQQVELIQKAGQKKFEAIHRIPQQDYYELSRAQERVWTAVEMGEDYGAYNMTIATILRNLNTDIFEKVLREVMQRHESLRTYFLSINDYPQQKVMEYSESLLSLEYIDIRNSQAKSQEARWMIEQEERTPFNLAEAPLVRIKLIHMDEDKHLLVLTMHHIISDAWSLNVLMNEIGTLYEAFIEGKENPLAPLKVQYKDFAVWHNRYLLEEKHKLEKYWGSILAKPIPKTVVPTDYPRAKVKTSHGKSVKFTIDSNTKDALLSLGNRNDASLFMVLLASFYGVLYHYSGEEDLLIGTPIAGREHIDLQSQVGFYLNMLPLRVRFFGKDSFKQLLMNVKDVTLGAYQHQAYPFDQMVDKFATERDLSHSPIFDIMFQLINVNTGVTQTREFGGVQIEDFNRESVQVKYDIFVNLFEDGESIGASVDYNTDLFKHETILRLIARYRKFMQVVVEDENKTIDQIEINEQAAAPQIVPAIRRR